MDEQGRVISVNGNKAKVLINRHAACGECGACQIGREKMTMETMANNEAKASPGDNVLVHMKFINVLKATSYAYGIPLIGFVIGMFIGWFLAPVFHFDQVIASFSLALAFVVIAYIILYIIEKRGYLHLKYEPIITEILKEENTKTVEDN